MDVQELFKEADVDMPTMDDIPMIEIDIDGIDNDAKKDAELLVETISRLYCDEEFMKSHPAFKKRIDTELESLRVLIKMRKTDEVAHDFLINAIKGNSGNASLYKSLAEIQKTILSITTKMNETIAGLNNLVKGYQLEFNFDPEPKDESNDTPEPDEISSTTCRGSKEFIRKMEQTENLFTPLEESENEEAE